MHRNRRLNLAAGSLAALVFCALPSWVAAQAENPLAPAKIADGIEYWEAVEDDPSLDEWRISAKRAEQEAEDAQGWRPLREGANPSGRITAHRPPSLAVPEGSMIGLQPRLIWLSNWATLQAAAADFDGAEKSWERAIGLGSQSVADWRGLGRMRVRAGEYQGAEAAFLAALGLAERAVPVRDSLAMASTLRELGELYLVAEHPSEAAATLERARPLAPGSERTGTLLALALARAGGGDAPQSLESQIELWPMPRSHHWRTQVESGLDSMLARAPASVEESVRSGDSSLTLAAGIALVLVLAFYLLARRMRKTGDLSVTIDYPDELEGFFAVHVHPQKGRYRRANPLSGVEVERRKSTHFSHFMVSRETQFQHLRSRRYYVTVSGILRDIGSEQALTEPFDEHSVDVPANGTARLEFDMGPSECPVDVRVRWDKRPATDVGVVARGLPQSLRFAASGEVRMRLPMGTHTIAVGTGDRVAECQVDVISFQPTEVEVNLAGTESLVFKGCPPAVQPYLHGDLNGAARALRSDGHENVAHLLLARLHQEQGHTERAAEQFESAGHTLEAAELRKSISDFERAAVLFEDSGDARQAAETYCEAGEWSKAGDLYEAIHEWEHAAACFRKVGDRGALIAVLERAGKLFEASELAEEADDRAGAVRLLQAIGRTDAHYLEACEKLVDAFDREGHSDLAAHKLEELIQAQGAMVSNPEQRSRLADLLVKAEEPDHALEVLEELRRREPTFPHVASRIETLRKQVSARKLETSDAGVGSATTATGADFASTQRYEILAEIGRGGMGVVYKALDRRLDREVALKRLPENLRDHPKALKLFMNEAQASARLNHPNIVTVFDTDQENGSFFITMELLEGYPLNDLLEQKGRIGPRDTARIGTQVAHGLQYAHERHVVHRDIKTANLFFTSEKVVKIMDFGLAKMMEQVRRGTTVIGGTPYYMAPEQAAGENVDYRADIYALGITLFELVTGRVPFDDGDITYHHRHTPPPDPRSVIQGVPDALANLILEMIRKSPDERVATSAEVAKRLEQMAARPS
jgi:tetratricopeptide (TPR) repeat protein